ncbi:MULTISPECIES: antirepressor AbbA [Bacillus cereus group]|uniref:Recombinase XerD n=1 Tax=Bacillus thuringiensis subsp. higo TaxID=132266 RepID=A0A9X6LV31_BACUH|nr:MULTISPECIES: antirepressor AbbA [Bacillus cereus group]KMQ09845.1 recombinase XerD [Bacillus cereus]MDM8361226.1 antirepressor AbbA [Bacillus thuringiensis]MED2790037.1 antirepressor AbbA [Bacillus thuringiensis]MED2810809.1 antirepressor AbbA [Bacillus thuringiensis]MED2828773.1 antirepressor AbbA [Bacillus thuringiensis]
MQREVVLTKEEESLLLDILFQQNYASEILAVELTDIENGLKQTDVVQYKKITRLFYRLKNKGY